MTAKCHPLFYSDVENSSAGGTLLADNSDVNRENLLTSEGLPKNSKHDNKRDELCSDDE